MFEIDLAKIKDLLLKNKLYVISVLAMIAISIPVSSYKNQRFEECEVLEIKAAPIDKISSNKAKMNFIAAHKFNGEKIDITEFVNNLANEVYSKISGIEVQEESKIGNVKAKEIKITGLFWHDVFIFDFLKKLQDFSPGFLNILSIDIGKFSNQISQKPILKLEVICKVYQK